MSNRKYSRPEVKQVSKQWVRENCKNVTERDKGLIRLLIDNNRRILRRDQIEVLYPEFPSSDYLNKRLKLLYDKHVIDRIYPAVEPGKGSSKQHICLDRAGSILLGLENYSKPISTKNGVKSLPLGWEHKVKLNDYECLIKKTVSELGGKVLLYQTEKALTFGDTKIIPDIFFLISCNKKGYMYFVEVDLGTEDLPYVKKKIDSYMKYYASKAWIREKWAGVFGSPVFPRVLFLTEEGRTKRVKALTEYTKDMSVKFRFGFHSDLKDLLGKMAKS
ncbi:plasmid replication-relaxation protein [Bacillus phage CampHawk]|uniref:Plasmid replication-relaxation protein n=2 Tax=Okubovirus camphawk TaxID=1986015 RepID=U5PTF3_9CAUD|nr:replication initiation by nicking [Bacillus phage CampHawk]AGY47006.1 plasmid replication-relaxation protein [Bacillus phage CampHawk]APZ82363.1 plasmid replication-relaxation protein [Bacillus phage vB_BsuM-Goe2]UNY49080.1 hypothetical protein sp82g_143 [Bacillus phage SP82G]